jgi:hypothetical protein
MRGEGEHLLRQQMWSQPMSLSGSTIPLQRYGTLKPVVNPVAVGQVKDRLVFEQKKIAAVEERRKAQENRKLSKALKSQKAKEKGDEKKRTKEAISQWQKTKQRR